MSIPLYQDHKVPDSLKDIRKTANAGLLFDRFFNKYQADWTLKDNDKSKWLKDIQGKVGQDQQLHDFCQRQIALVAQLHGQTHCFKNDWHWVSGMGNPHPVENGLTWHSVLGVPYLTGASVKGLVRAWVEMNDDGLDEAALKNRLVHWFGADSTDDSGEQSGGLIFFDAIPESPVTVITDIMTPHMGKWYSDGEMAGSAKPETVPADWHEPVPIPFLAVKGGGLIFSIAPGRKDMATQLPDVFKALENALNYLGAGAKTATGYGYFSMDTQFSSNLEKQRQQQEAEQKQAEQLKQQLAGQSEIAQRFITQMHEQDWENNDNNFWTGKKIEDWLTQLEAMATPDHTVITHLVQLLERHQPGLLANPDKTKGKKQKPVYSQRQREIARRVNTLRNTS